ncbi:MAG: hypothetical protein L6Q67_19720 [Zoogloea sp.]|nr:hypothetical protein [Zoogloea sp.]
MEMEVSSPKSEFRKRVRKLSDTVAQIEAKNTKPPKVLIQSFESDLLKELDFLLLMSNCPPILRSHLDRIKQLAMDAWVIDLEMKAGTLKIMAAKGDSFTGNTRGRSAFYALVEVLLKRHGPKTSAKRLWSILEAECGGLIIDEITDDDGGLIYLREKEHPVSFRAFEKQLSEIRKTLKG